jgi:hypothetical protein
LAEQVVGSFQGINDTTACPKADAYGSGYVCEWWAPVSVKLPGREQRTGFGKGRDVQEYIEKVGGL